MDSEVKLEKQEIEGKSNSYIAGKDTHLNSGMSLEYIQKMIDGLMNTVAKQSEELGSLKNENENLIERIEFMRRISCSVKRRNGKCDNLVLTEILERSNYYESIYKYRKKEK